MINTVKISLLWRKGDITTVATRIQVLITTNIPENLPDQKASIKSSFHNGNIPGKKFVQINQQRIHKKNI